MMKNNKDVSLGEIPLVLGITTKRTAKKEKPGSEQWTAALFVCTYRRDIIEDFSDLVLQHCS